MIVNSDVILCLLNVNAIIVFHYTEALEWLLEELIDGITYKVIGSFCRTCDGKVINLAKKDYRFLIHCASVEAWCMCGRSESQFLNKGINVFCPLSRGFRVSL